jgi:hypothetical protein
MRPLAFQVKAFKAGGCDQVHVTFAYKHAPPPPQAMQATMLLVLRAGMPLQKVKRTPRQRTPQEVKVAPRVFHREHVWGSRG